MRIMVLGADGYLGWPTCMYLANKGHEILAVDCSIKREWEKECGVSPLIEIPHISRRVGHWNNLDRGRISYSGLNINTCFSMRFQVREFKPDAIVHYAEQASAPYSHISSSHCIETQRNNILGTLSLIHAVLETDPSIHIVKLGTMGEYGTPNMPIEEGWLDVYDKEGTMQDRVLFPKRPGSWYHLSKVHDSNNLEFACRTLGLAVTDLNQGIVYGIETDETWLLPELRTSFHYDHIFGTVLNRFLAQAAIGYPLTVYGTGGQTRTFLNILDTLQCVELALLNPAKEGVFRVFNQFTETFSVNELADLVQRMTRAEIQNIDNPRIEAEDHSYEVKNTKLKDLGLEPHLLDSETLEKMYKNVEQHKDKINPDSIMPTVNWRK